MISLQCIINTSKTYWMASSQTWLHGIQSNPLCQVKCICLPTGAHPCAHRQPCLPCPSVGCFRMPSTMWCPSHYNNSHKFNYIYILKHLRAMSSAKGRARPKFWENPTCAKCVMPCTKFWWELRCLKYFRHKMCTFKGPKWKISHGLCQKYPFSLVHHHGCCLYNLVWSC